MLNIVCVNAGNYQGRGAEYVNILFDMIRRNLAEGFKGRFVCFTDDPTGLDSDIVARPLLKELRGWWHKIYLFAPGLFNDGDRVLYFDLDTVITGRLDEIAAYDGEFAILRDLFHDVDHGLKRYNKWQSAVMAWKAGFGGHIWQRFEDACYPDVRGGDQVWIAQNQDSADILQDLFPNLFCSYKKSGRKLPKRESVVCFHGRPRPHEVVDGWVPEVWKIGGISRAELDVICNTETAKIHGNIELACKRNLPHLQPQSEHDKHACIVGGGPWLIDAVDEIRAMQGFGHEVWALNNTHDWLIDRGIIPSACVLLDARDENAQFVKNARADVHYYVASQCSPLVFDALQGKTVTIFHNATEGAQELLLRVSPVDSIHLLGGGTTVGMKALVLARFLGFKNFHLYGMDSSYRDNNGHAYPQDLNNNERVLDVFSEGRKFRCAPWMITQANDFIEMAKMLVNEDCVITVAGDGLIGHIARTMARDLEPDNEIVEIDGVWWPSKDREHDIIIDRMGDLEDMVAFCRGFDVAIQAGGNCGVWPQALSDKFSTVYTFEPDWLNFRCLSHNATAPNIIKFQAALGKDHSMIDLDRNPLNCGAHHVKGGGNIPVLRIDDLNLSACDLLQLDIEGFELNALKGAEETIRKFSPVIVIEENGTSERYGVKTGEAGEWLKQFGYTLTHQVHRDLIFTIQPKEAIK